jgi:sortase A
VKKPCHWLYAAVLPTAAFFSALLLAEALWIPLKAELAQWLIERSWQETLRGNPGARPWPWADTRAVAVLSVPKLGVSQVVLEGNSGRNLAFGPVLLDGSLNGRDRIISGHRDTHFRFLEFLQAGDRIRLATRETSRWFEVRYVDIVDSRKQQLIVDPGIDRVSLVTCYPFSSLQAGGPLRYVVTALPVENGVSPRQPSSG